MEKDYFRLFSKEKRGRARCSCLQTSNMFPAKRAIDHRPSIIDHSIKPPHEDPPLAHHCSKQTMAPSTKRSDKDWLASLARQATTSDIASSSSNKKAKGKSSSVVKPSIRSKAERIQHRQEKKAKREERKQKADEEKRARLAKKKETKQQGRNDVSVSSKRVHLKAKDKSLQKGMTPSSKKALTKLSSTITSTISSIPQPSRYNRDLINGLPPPPKGKATKQSTINSQSTELQPRNRDYNGQGLARPSLYLPLNDATFIPRLEEEFAEHIPGFFGKSKVNAVKKQRGEDMLWKKRLEEKQRENSGGTKKKKKVDMI